MKRHVMSIAWMLFALMHSTSAVTFELRHRFHVPPQYAQAPLVQAPNGLLYGTTTAGGEHGYGSVFSLTTGGVFQIVWSFRGDEGGASPIDGVVVGHDGALYGTTSEGGSALGGIIFRVTTGGVFSNLHAFQSHPEGYYPWAELMRSADGYLYGTTVYGGTNGNGSIFRISTSGQYTQIWSFAGDVYGSQPQGVLVEGPDRALYGTCSFGGADNQGLVYRLTTNRVFTILYSFTGGASSGGRPYGGLTPPTADGTMLGTTSLGGSNNYGTIYRIHTSGAFTSLWSFTFYGNDGGYPYTGLIRSTNGLYYGVTLRGTTNWSGALFRLNASGNVTSLWRLVGSRDGYDPYARLYLSTNGLMYGVCLLGGTNGVGTAYRWSESTGLNVVWHFQPAPAGRSPLISLTKARDGAWYGVTEFGGAHNLGNVFRMDSSGFVTSIWSFGFSPEGNTPRGELLAEMNNPEVLIYGTTYYGGDYYGGTAFQITTAGTMDVYSFGEYSTNSFHPNGGVVRGPDQAFYGTAWYGGTSNYGTVYRLDTNPTERVLHHFHDSDGRHPMGTLAVASNGVFYGITKYGGSNDQGTVFRITTNGHFTTLWHFLGAPDGAQPENGPVLGRDGALYGTTPLGGENNAGSVYRLTTNGVMTTLWSFMWLWDGAMPHGSLIQGRDHALYGTTIYGGDNSDGTVFRITTNGQLKTLWSFTGENKGGAPYGRLAEDGDWLYGTTYEAAGTIFRLSMLESLYMHTTPTGRHLTWTTTNGVLQSTANAHGAYTNIVGAKSPYPLPPYPEPARFFRLFMTNAP